MSDKEDRGRLRVPGRSVDTGACHRLGVLQEAGGSWVVPGPGAAVRVEAEVRVLVGESVFEHARRGVGR